MSTDLSQLLGKTQKRKNSAATSSTASATKKSKRKTKEERDAEHLQYCLLQENKFVCDYESYTVKGIIKVPSSTSASTRTKIVWLDDRAPSAELLQQMGSNTRRLARESIGIQSKTSQMSRWQLEREKRAITSSKIARQLAMAEPFVLGIKRLKQSFESLLEDANLIPRFQGNELTQHGERMEPFARKVYMQTRAKQHVIELGFILHRTNRLCGASPDGVLLDGSRLVELKCPMQRSFQQGDSVPLGYWHQCQLQMEVCDVDKLDYFEARFMKRPRGLRTNCVFVLRDRSWFESIQQPIERYANVLERLKKLRSLFPDTLFASNESAEKAAAAAAAAAGPNISSMFSGVVLKE